MRPLIAITTDLMIRNDRPTAFSAMTYTNAVLAAGGIPVLLPPTPGHTYDLISRFDAFILTGGDDPITEPFGAPTHPKAVRVHEHRQNFETQLLIGLKEHPQVPTLGVCLGMQMMGLAAGGVLNQNLPDTHSSHGDHWEHTHQLSSDFESIIGSGSIYSKHRQALSDPGELRTIAIAHDGVIEAIDDPNRAFYLGVQWHPERTEHAPLGQKIFDDLVNAARA